MKVAFYNTENLFDTIRNPLISDGEYTPQGARHWDTQRYACKIGRIARVLDELNADIVGRCVRITTTSTAIPTTLAVSM